MPDKQIIRNKYGLFTNYVLIMVASFSDNKDFDLFIEVAKSVNFIRNDVSFIAVGDGINLIRIKKKVVQ